jgi:hypothetical protein
VSNLRPELRNGHGTLTYPGKSTVLNTAAGPAGCSPEEETDGGGGEEAAGGRGVVVQVTGVGALKTIQPHHRPIGFNGSSGSGSSKEEAGECPPLVSTFHPEWSERGLDPKEAGLAPHQSVHEWTGMKVGRDIKQYTGQWLDDHEHGDGRMSYTR